MLNIRFFCILAVWNVLIIIFTLIISNFLAQDVVKLNGKFISSNGIPLEGKFQKLNETGSLNFSYIDGQQNGKFISFHENGKIKDKGYYNMGVKVGKWKSFSIGGLLISEVSFNNLGKKDGIWKVWNDNGELSAIIIYDSGNRIGNWKSLDKHSQIAQTENY